MQKLFFALAPCLRLASASAEVLREVDLGYARYQTNLSLSEGVTSFLGIRFATPPTDDQRFRAPQPPQHVVDVQNATRQPCQCQQASIFGSPGLSTRNPFRQADLGKRDISITGPICEDCLFLNVHTPSDSNELSLLPVVVYFYSGGYDGGNLSAFPAQDFVKESNHGVVVVQSQYRLGLFGFLPGQAVKDDGDLNAGLLDQQFALKWVQEHIIKFGGDPTEVTIWGQSAGAGSVLEHIVANNHGGKDRPLFRAAIMNSPFLPFHYYYNDTIPEKLYNNAVSFANCSSSSDTLACLRSADASTLLDADSAIGSNNFLETYTFVPVIDGVLITERPTVSLDRGLVNGEVVLITTNSHEGNFFVNSTTLVTAGLTLTDYITQLFPRLNETLIQATASIYSRSEFATLEAQAGAVYGESIIICPAYYVLDAFGGRGWKGEFAIEPGTHALDLSYEFLTFAIPPTFNNSAFQKAFAQSFLSLSISQDPNIHIEPSDIKPFWPLWSHGSHEMFFNKTETDVPIVEVMQTDSGLLERCRWWKSISSVVGQ
ncbi:hypothetical protein ACEPAG_5806 [Sanghuangporus baumii]